MRYPGEGDVAFTAFAAFLDSGWSTRGTAPRRVVRRLEPLERTYQPHSIASWRAQFDWETRAEEYDSAIMGEAAGALREVIVDAHGSLASFASMSARILATEFERTLSEHRRKGKAVPLETIVKMAESLGKLTVGIRPLETAGGQPNFGELPEDALIRGEVLSLEGDASDTFAAPPTESLERLPAPPAGPPPGPPPPPLPEAPSASEVEPDPRGTFGREDEYL